MNGRALHETRTGPGRVVRAGLAGCALLVAAVLAAGCEVEPPNIAENVPPSFADLPPLVFDLGGIEVVERPATPHPDDVVQYVPTSPAVAARLWVEDRLRTSGAAGLLRVTIDEASARSSPISTNVEFEDLFTAEQNERLDVRLRVIIEVIDEDGAVRGSTTADARRSRTLPEGITLAERERIYDEIVGALLFDFNASQEEAIRHYLEIYLR